MKFRKLLTMSIAAMMLAANPSVSVATTPDYPEYIEIDALSGPRFFSVTRNYAANSGIPSHLQFSEMSPNGGMWSGMLPRTSLSQNSDGSWLAVFSGTLQYASRFIMPFDSLGIQLDDGSFIHGFEFYLNVLDSPDPWAEHFHPDYDLWQVIMLD